MIISNFTPEKRAGEAREATTHPDALQMSSELYLSRCCTWLALGQEIILCLCAEFYIYIYISI